MVGNNEGISMSVHPNYNKIMEFYLAVVLVAASHTAQHHIPKTPIKIHYSTIFPASYNQTPNSLLFIHDSFEKGLSLALICVSI